MLHMLPSLMDYPADGHYPGHPRPTAASRKCYSSTTHPSFDWSSILLLCMWRETCLPSLLDWVDWAWVIQRLSKAHCIPGGSDSCTGCKPNSWSWSNFYHQEEYQEVKPSEESSTSQKHQWPTSPLAKTFSWPRNRERLLLMALCSPT